MNQDIPGRKQGHPLILRADTRKKTRRIVFAIPAVVVVLTVGFLVWSLRPIILPIIVGTFAAYICFPLLSLFLRIGIPRPAGILILFGAFFLAVMVIANQIGSIMPDEREWLVLRTRFQYKLNERYRNFMGLGESEQTGNIIYKYFGNDLNRFMDSINQVLNLNKEERLLFMKYRWGFQNKPRIKDRYYEYFLKNTESLRSEDEFKNGAFDEGKGKNGDLKKES